jgi:hypothetical protein
MPLDGLRAWIGEVERKLGVRTRVFLVLAVIAVGGAGAAIVLAIDAQNSSVSDGDVQALQEQLEARIAEGASGAGATQLEAEVKALQEEVKALQGGGSSGKAKSGGQSGSSGSSGGDSSSGSAEQGTGSTAPESKNLQELLRRAKEQQK